MKSGRVWSVLLCIVFWTTVSFLRGHRIVYPQAALGPIAGDSFEVDLRLGNKNDASQWNGTIRLLEQMNLQGMSDLTFFDGTQSVNEDQGDHQVSIPPNQSKVYRITTDTFQVGVLVIEADNGSSLEDLVPSFYYRVVNGAGVVTDLIAIEGVMEAARAYRLMISNLSSFQVGVAMVPEKFLDNGIAEPVLVDMVAILANGSEVSGTVQLGGGEDAQKALFPRAVLNNLPDNEQVAQLRLSSNDNIYLATLALGTPPDFQDVQIGAAPALPDLQTQVTGLQVDRQNRQAVVDFFDEFYLPSNGILPDWDGNVANCQVGDVSAAFRDAVLRRINYFRAMTGVPADIVFADEFDDKAAEAALIMAAQNALSHTPDPSWPCFTDDGREGAERSNLGFSTTAGANLVDQYIMDSGAGNFATGHRRWILFPRQNTMGLGVAVNQSATFNALWVIGDFDPGPQVRSAWPPDGFVPSEVVFPRWSFSFPGADFSNATVTMTEEGQPVTLTIEPVEDGFGDNTIVWVPQVLSETPSTDTTFTVTIANVLVNGGVQEFEYDVTVIP